MPSGLRRDLDDFFDDAGGAPDYRRRHRGHSRRSVALMAALADIFP